MAEHCFKCHGQDEKERKADLQLDDRENVIAMDAIVPGRSDVGTLIERIVTTDVDEIMPPPEEHKPLKPEQIELIKRWLAEGAKFEKHWSFIPPVMPQVPTVKTEGGARVVNEVDAFVLKRLEEKGMNQAAEATREAWLRRVTFDLTGLPPTLAEQDAFFADQSEGARAKVVDRLLSAPEYGEHMAVGWLDVARFADTFGRHEDHDSQTWPYRDWVIRAFNDNLPYDQFVKWQTAGDMMPGATQDMYLATVFNRLPQQSNEAGSDEEEFRQEIVADRVNTNGIAFLGLSMECARCHDHKYDPISTREYYSMAAFLNNIDECGLYTVYTTNIPAPSMFIYEGDDERQHANVKLKMQFKEAEREATLPEAKRRFERWLKELEGRPAAAKPLVHLDFEGYLQKEEKTLKNLADADRSGLLRRRTDFAEGHIGQALYFKEDNAVTVPGVGQYSRTQPFSFSIWLKPTVSQERALVVHYSRAGLDAGSQGYELLMEDDRLSFALCHFWPGNAMRVKMNQPLTLSAWSMVTVTYDGSSRAAGIKMYLNGLPAVTEVDRDRLYKDIKHSATFMDKDGVNAPTLTVSGRHNDKSLDKTYVDEFYFWDRELAPVEVKLLGNRDAANKPEDWFAWWLREKDPVWRKLSQELKELRDEENVIAMRMKEVMVMREIPEEKRRPTFVQERGHFQAIGERVRPDVPASVFEFPEDLPRTRLGYAEWLVDRRNPLTARVFVNRIWQQFFGRGLVVTSEDFGVQGQLPTHPELMDWLAVWFMDNGWDVKALCRLLVLSATYGQDSMPVERRWLEDDLDNALLARGPRTRLSAEQLRDNVLAVSGLLVKDLGGPPTKPYQPAGLWEDSGTQHSYHQDHGARLFRRSCYTFWRRTLPPPSMTVFDAPTREFCKSRRDRSSTPLQALVLFNDPQFLEAARVLAEKLVRDHPGDDLARVETAFRLFTGRKADAMEREVLTALLRDQRSYFAGCPEEAERLRSENGEAPVAKELSAVEVAASTMLTRALLGYEDSVVKP
ncbi:DUF1553 domain-containing protein [Phragmitibacter flavus]|uniref:DUF1553 domain-containing protein n=1 Tax=Phragmitibacter flavus TaxID=2576071 RepID=A0A5R8KAB3_9BACT|nr:DUF1553 domain-containing protein [Phragmitibacter flavus]